MTLCKLSRAGPPGLVLLLLLGLSCSPQRHSPGAGGPVVVTPMAAAPAAEEPAPEVAETPTLPAEPPAPEEEAPSPEETAATPQISGLWRSETGALVRIRASGEDESFPLSAWSARGEELFQAQAQWQAGGEQFTYPTTQGDRISGVVSSDGIRCSNAGGSWSALWTPAGPRELVEMFYQAYQRHENKGREKLVREQRENLAPELADLLLDIMDNPSGEDEPWLDFDPFINGQMNATTIRVREAVEEEDDLARVPVDVSYRSPGHDERAVEVVVRQGQAGWRIANFSYPEREGTAGWDLLSWLQKKLGGEGPPDS